MSIIPIPADMVEGSECLAYGVPWIVPEAIFKLDDLLTRDDFVLEVGTGGSTLFFGSRCGFVTSVETSESWAASVYKETVQRGLWNTFIFTRTTNESVCDFIKECKDDTTVLLVDSQGGYNRSLFLNIVLEKKMPSLRIIILDNYSHQGLFPDHFNGFDLGPEWEVFTYDHDRWAGSGTKIFIRKI